LPRALELNRRACGENSHETATSLQALANTYFTQRNFAKSEAFMTRSLKNFETMYGQDSFQLTLPVAGLCQACDASGQAEGPSESPNESVAARREILLFDCYPPGTYAGHMLGKSRRVETESELYEAAVRALMRRAYSVYEMKQLLGRRTEDDHLLGTVMDRLKRAKMIDDERFAKQFVRQRTEIRRQGKFRIARDLRARGVLDRHIEAALAETAKETDEATIVRQRLERKLRSFQGEIDERKTASMYRSLLRAGFSADVVRRELKALTREEVREAESELEE
jgi:regulatory protein